MTKDTRKYDINQACSRHNKHPLQAIECLTLGNSGGGGRPSATAIESCVGKETVSFAAPLPLEGKVRA